MTCAPPASPIIKFESSVVTSIVVPAFQGFKFRWNARMHTECGTLKNPFAKQKVQTDKRLCDFCAVKELQELQNLKKLKKSEKTDRKGKA